MGTWGYNPKDGDGPNDTVGKIINRGVTVSLIFYFDEIPTTTADYWERIGVVQILSDYHYKIPFSVLEKCQEYLDLCLSDKDWIQEWDCPEAFLNSAHDFKKRLETIINKTSDEEKLKGEFGLIETPELAETKKWGPGKLTDLQGISFSCDE